MSKGNEPIAQTYYEITETKHTQVETCLDYFAKAFTLLKNAYTAKGMELVSLNDLAQILNKYFNAVGGKDENQCVLKGKYKDGFNGADCYQNAPYLFFDIDVKETENPNLLNAELNNIAFSELQKVAVLVWRSNSGNGIAGVLYVPQLANYLNDEKTLHLEAGKAITRHLSEHLHDVTGIKIKFDNAQSKFRQVRFLAEQRQVRTLNQKPFEFSYKVEQKKKEIAPGVIKYRPDNYQKAFGTIEQQFDSQNDIFTIAQNNGFQVVGSSTGNEIRVKHHSTESKTSGFINRLENRYINFSESVSPYNSFTPSQMVCKFQFNNDYNAFLNHLNALGYKERAKDDSQIKEISKALKSELETAKDNNDAGQIIFKYCYDLETLTPAQKALFIKENCPRPELKKHFTAYLNLTDYKIKFDKELIIKKYVSEQLPAILDYSDKYKKIILRAETGKGKTTAFILDFLNHRPDSRVLILEPLTIIIKQNEKEYKNKAIYLDGTSTKADFEQAESKSIVFATYEQGAKLLSVSKFDYIVIDEIHQLLIANSFKSEVIENLTPYLSDSKIIGLTGTPTAIFKNIGYKFLNVDVIKPEKTKVEIRFLNNNPFLIALSHLRNTNGKTLIRLNDIKALEALKKQLMATKLYKKNEILVLHSDKKIKSSQDFEILAHQRKFESNIKLVLTTSLIDEGLSINQNGFTDIVFIETSYNPRPEPIKQFFARFRNEDPNRKNYLYLRTTNDQTPGRFNPEKAYKDNLQALKNDADQIGENDIKSTYNAIFNNDAFYYNDNSINPYYLAYSVTEILFKSFNMEQFLNYLESNYNLEFSKSKDFDFDPDAETIETAYRSEVKKRIAGAWYLHKKQVLQALACFTLDNGIRKDLTIKQMAIDPKINSIVMDNIKDFEKLYKRYKALEMLGSKNPDSILISRNIQNEITLTSEKEYKDELTLLRLNKMIFEPKNKADLIANTKVIKFAEWCENTKEFTSFQMFRKLKEIGVYKNSDFSLNHITRLLNWFEIDVQKETNGLIKIKKRNHVRNI